MRPILFLLILFMGFICFGGIVDGDATTALVTGAITALLIAAFILRTRYWRSKGRI
jgi:hypothetical protein